MNEPISEMDKQLRDTPRVSLVIAIVMNKGKRNACLFLGIIALVVILSFGWSKWLLLLPAALGISSFLFQMNILIVSSELKRRSEEPEEEPTPSEAEEVDEGRRRLEFMKSHKEIITARLYQYLDENPDVDDITDEVREQVVEECYLDHRRSEISNAILGRGIFEENLGGGPVTEARAGAIV